MSIIVNGIELTEVIYAGVNLDTVKVKKGTAEAVTVFEKITQLATPQNVTADGTTVSWDTVENATSYAVLADGSEIGTVEAAATDELAGTWVFNDTLDFPAGTTEWNINFISNNIVYTAIRITAKFGGQIIYIDNSSSEFYVYEGGIWQYEVNKTVTITSKLSEVTNGDTLLAWLQANATKQ